MNGFGNRLRKLREQHEMTLRYLADRADLSYSFIASLEKGRYNPSRETVCALAAALDTDKNELLILAGYLPNDTVDQAISSLKSNRQPKEFVLENLLQEDVSFKGITLSDADKNALLAFMQTMFSLRG
ncbi:helix-turn-helix domain-containing protein [Sporosarcina ureae]|uniref:helix-turn-helix domain-containing protein n=1 Tax=Sporosarcina ureae TaxID=1571 RepID=UPI0026F0C7DE|nr:XRE family transcriptional regulator [Sporosarcina ureae]